MFLVDIFDLQRVGVPLVSKLFVHIHYTREVYVLDKIGVTGSMINCFYNVLQPQVIITNTFKLLWIHSE